MVLIQFLILSQIIDLCYKVLTSLHGSAYISDIDNLLDFSNKLSTLRLKRHKPSTQRENNNNNCNGRPRLPLPEEADDPQEEGNHYSTTPTLKSRGGSSETMERDKDLNKIFSLIDLQSVDNLLIETKVDSGCSASGSSSNSSQLSSPGGEYELIELKEMPKKCSAEGLLLQKSFEEQPLYQAYSEVSLIDIVYFFTFSSIPRVEKVESLQYISRPFFRFF